MTHQEDEYKKVPMDDVGITGATLRLTPSKNKQEKNVRWAKDYEL